MRSSTLDFPEEEGGQEGVDYGELLFESIRKLAGIGEYPESLMKDKTKVGKQATLVHTADNGELYRSMQNGLLTLHKDGTWTWSKR